MAVISKNIIKAVRTILLADATITSYITTKENTYRCYARMPMKSDMITPTLTLWLDDNGQISNLPGGKYTFEVSIWNSILNSTALTVVQDIKDRIKVLLHNKATTINSQGVDTNVYTFDWVSANLSDEHVGELKLWYMPCIFNCIIGD